MQRSIYQNYMSLVHEMDAATSDSLIDQCLQLAKQLTPLAVTEVTIVNQLILSKASHLLINNDYGFCVRGELCNLSKQDWHIFASILKLLDIKKLNLRDCSFVSQMPGGLMCWSGLIDAAHFGRLSCLILPASIGNNNDFIARIMPVLKANISYPHNESSLLKSCARFFVRNKMTDLEKKTLPSEVIELIAEQKEVMFQQAGRNPCITFVSQYSHWQIC